MKILIADDETTSRMILEEVLQEWGYETYSVGDGKEAWHTMQASDAPTLLILDWMMPEMDGTELCRRLRASQNSQYVYIILLTSKSDKKDVILGMDSGADAFLAKPVDFDELKSHLAAGNRILAHQTHLKGDAIGRKTSIKPTSEKTPTASINVAMAEKYIDTIQDLSRDSVLARAPRKQFGNQIVPALGKVIILSKVGEGGMGTVYRGYNPRLQTEVAVKVLSAELFRKNTEAAARFYREAQIAAHIKSDHLVSVMDVDQENGLVYLLMEYVDGESAGSCLEKTIDGAGGGLPEEVVLDLSIGAAKGLAAAHAGGIVHRDIKPDNILAPYNDDRSMLVFKASKLADLGIARHELQEEGITEENAALGTAGYMSPEQIHDAKSAGKPSDIFNLGATMYALLCARTPFLGTSAYEVMCETINRPHKPLQAWNKNISATTTAIIDTCLAKHTSQRYADGAALLEDLIYCRKLLETTRHIPSSSNLPRVIDTSMEQFDCYGIPSRLAIH